MQHYLLEQGVCKSTAHPKFGIHPNVFQCARSLSSYNRSNSVLMSISSQLYSTCKIKTSDLGISKRQNSISTQHTCYLALSGEASFREMPHFCPLPGTLSDPLVYNQQVVSQSHARNKTRCFDTIFTRLLLGLSENGIRNSGFQLHPALLKLLKAFLLMHVGTASASKLACSQ